MDPAQRARIAAKAAANAEYVEMMNGLRPQAAPTATGYNVFSEMGNISRPAPADIRHGPANHGTDVAQVQASQMADAMREQVKETFDLAGFLNKKSADIEKQELRDATVARIEDRIRAREAATPEAKARRKREQEEIDESDYVHYGLPAEQQTDAYQEEAFLMGW